MLIVGIGGTYREGSSSEAALRAALSAVRSAGSDVKCFGAGQIDLPMYRPNVRERTPEAVDLLTSVRDADGLILSSPGYHGTVSGMVKNALDYLEDLSDDGRPYLDGLPVGCISVAHGWQAAVNTLGTLRDIVHSLRGWPTPYGAAINASLTRVREGEIEGTPTGQDLARVGEQVISFALGAKGALRPLKA